MDRRTLLAISLSFLVFIGWQKFYLEPRMQQQQSMQPAQGHSQAQAPQANATGQPPAATGPTGETVQPAPTPENRPLETKIVSAGTGDALVGNGGKFFVGWDLKNYHKGLAPAAAAVDLKAVTNQEGQVEIAFDAPTLAYLNNVPWTFASAPQGVIASYEDANVRMSREITSAPNVPYLDLRVTVEFKTKPAAFLFVSLASQRLAEKDAEEQDRQLVYWTNDSLERVQVTDVALKDIASPVHFIGATSRYFVLTLVNQAPTDPRALLQPLSTGAGRISMVYPVTGSTVSVPLRVYFGPKELQTLRAVDPKLDHTVDFGWFTIFAYPLLKIMKWFYQYVGNYGVAIILLTLLLKILTYPLTYKSMKSMKEMAKLQPQLQALRDKHKDDKEALNREMMVMMRSHGYNPMAGCLPILIQMPIFFALYRVLYSSIELYHAPFMLWIVDLSAHDHFYVTPVLLSLTMFIQQKLTPNTATDPMQQKMLQFMPLIFGVFMLALPSGLTLYMLTNALASIVQQIILNKKLDMANVTSAPARAR